MARLRTSLHCIAAALVTAVIVTAPRLLADGTSLGSGASLGPGSSVTSPGGSFTLIYQNDGNLVVYRQDGTPVWWTGTDGTSPGAVTVTSGGDIVMFDASGSVLWRAGTDGHPGDALVMQDSGAVQVVDVNGAVLFDSGSGNGSSGACGGFAGGNTLGSGQILCTNSQVISPSATFFLVYQNDGNLVEYRNDDTPVFWTSTDGTSAGHVSMGSDGNLAVVSSSGDVLWTSGTGGNPGASLVLADDGSLSIVAPGGSVIWTTGPR
jgi:hypothetical protein